MKFIISISLKWSIGGDTTKQLDKIEFQMRITEGECQWKKHTYIEERRLEWYGHVRGATTDRWISRITLKSPRKKEERPGTSFRDEVDVAMEKQNLREGGWNDRK